VSSVSATLGTSFTDSPIRKAFMRWQCRVRQTAMRDYAGRPDDSITPALYLSGEDVPMGHVITLINKAPGYSVTPELQHMAAKTNDPAERREKAIQFFSSTYYQKAGEFSDILTSTFPPESPGAAAIHEAKTVRLRFEAYAQAWDLPCKVWKLAGHNPLYQATLAHNRLFNPDLHPDTVVLGFEPDWGSATSDPEVR